MEAVLAPGVCLCVRPGREGGEESLGHNVSRGDRGKSSENGVCGFLGCHSAGL